MHLEAAAYADRVQDRSVVAVGGSSSYGIEHACPPKDGVVVLQLSQVVQGVQTALETDVARVDAHDDVRAQSVTLCPHCRSDVHVGGADS